jgi:hypothetical protein
MELVKGLGDNEHAMLGDELLSLIRYTGVTLEELTQGFALLISSFSICGTAPWTLWRRHPQAPGACVDARRGAADHGGALTAAALGESPLRWRRTIGAITLITEVGEGPTPHGCWPTSSASRRTRGRNGQAH